MKGRSSCTSAGELYRRRRLHGVGVTSAATLLDQPGLIMELRMELEPAGNQSDCYCYLRKELSTFCAPPMGACSWSLLALPLWYVREGECYEARSNFSALALYPTSHEQEMWVIRLQAAAMKTREQRPVTARYLHPPQPERPSSVYLLRTRSVTLLGMQLERQR